VNTSPVVADHKPLTDRQQQLIVSVWQSCVDWEALPPKKKEAIPSVPSQILPSSCFAMELRVVKRFRNV